MGRTMPSPLGSATTRGRPAAALLGPVLFLSVVPIIGPAGSGVNKDHCSSSAMAATADSVAVRLASSRFVFLGSTHGGVKRHQFLLCLVSRPPFQRTTTDLVVEFGSPAHQGRIDRYLLELADIPIDSLRPVWFDTARPELWATLPQIPEFFRVVRSVNESLPLEDRLRVLGGNQPVDWSEVRSIEDLAGAPFKTNFTAHLITTHLAEDPEARVLVVYGDGHIRRGGTLTGDVEAVLDSDSLFIVGTIGSLREGERDLMGAFGDPDTPWFLDGRRFPDVAEIPALPDDLVTLVTDSRTSVTEFLERGGQLRDVIDAVLYLGPEPDRDMIGTIPLSEEERRQLRRRRQLGGREALELRYGSRRRWFEDHPDEIPPDPRRGWR